MVAESHLKHHTMIDFEIYRNEHRTIAWGSGDDQSAQPGTVIIDPPEYVVDRHGDQFTRIDEDGYVPRYDLEHMPLDDAQRIAARAGTDEVGARSSREEIVDALSPDVASQSAESEREESNAWQELEEESGQRTEDVVSDLVDE